MAPSTAPLRPRQAQSVPIATEPALLVAERLRRRGPTSTRLPHTRAVSHMPVASSPSLVLAPQAWPALLLPGRSLFALSYRLHRACTQLSISAPLLTTAGALAARCVQLREAVEVRRHPRWRQAAESSGVCMRAAGATCEPGSGRPRWRPPEAARDLRPHGVLRRRLVAGEVCRLQALPRVTALLTALLLAPQAGWPCQHAVLALPGPRRLDGSFAGRQESGQSAASPLHCVLTLTRRAHTWRTRSSTCRAATAPTSSPPEAQARSHRSSVRRASLSVPQQEGALGYRPCLHWRGPRSTTSTRSVSARQAGRRVPRQYISSIRRQCPVRVFFCVKFWAQCVTLL